MINSPMIWVKSMSEFLQDNRLDKHSKNNRLAKLHKTRKNEHICHGIEDETKHTRAPRVSSNPFYA